MSDTDSTNRREERLLGVVGEDLPVDNDAGLVADRPRDCIRNPQGEETSMHATDQRSGGLHRHLPYAGGAEP